MEDFTFYCHFYIQIITTRPAPAGSLEAIKLPYKFKLELSHHIVSFNGLENIEYGGDIL